MKRVHQQLVPILLFVGYLISTIVNSNFWGNILSPIVTLIAFYYVLKGFFLEVNKEHGRTVGLFLSMGVLSWAFADVAWAIADMVCHQNPNDIFSITSLYELSNLFILIAISIYALSVFRKWNVVQVILDSIVIVILIIIIIWTLFLDKNAENILVLRGDWPSILCIIFDITIVLWTLIWFISIRHGKIPLFLKFTAASILLFSISDLIYHYQYFYSNYVPNSLIDAAFVVSFGLLAVAGYVRKDYNINEEKMELYNMGKNGRGYFLLAAPLLVILTKGFISTILFRMVSVILFYYLISGAVRKTEYKEQLLRREKELNSQLEQKVKLRTEELMQKNQELEQMIHRDYITGLPNRRYLLNYLEKEIAEIDEKDTIILFYIDINRFKMITTMFGHFIGEQIISEMARRLKPLESRLENALLSVYGYDMFIITARGRYDYGVGYQIAEEVIKLCSDVYRISKYQIQITVNIGISILPFDATTKEELIKHADIAMNQIRQKGFNLAQEFDLKLSEEFFRRNTIEILLKRAVFNQEFMLYYQPQLQIAGKKLIGFEALLRWKTSHGDFISPSEFIPIAEETGCIVPVGDWVMKNAVNQIAKWNKKAEVPLKIGINVSLKQLNVVQFMEDLMNEIDRLKLMPEWIDLEITESLQIQDNPEVINALNEIRRIGITISIDDFGTGFSSLSYLKNIPADRIKIAKELINYVHMDDFNHQLVKSIISLSKAKGIKVIAEGVETEAQWEVLRELGCDEVQGYLFGKPMPPQEIEKAFYYIFDK